MSKATEFKHSHGESSRRLLDLKPAIDRIIADARADAGDLQEGLNVLRSHQIDIIDQLDPQQYPHDREQVQYQNSYQYHPEIRENITPYQNIGEHLEYRGDLQKNQIRNRDQRLANQFDERYEDDSYLDQDYPSYDHQYYPGETNYYNTNYNNRGHIPAKGSYNYRDYQEIKQRDDTNSQNLQAMVRNLISQNNHLKGLVRRLQQKLSDTEYMLRKAQSRTGYQQLREQLQILKRENQDLRHNTILLLEKPSHSYNSDDHKLHQLQVLKQQIQAQDQLKQEFLEELKIFKAKYKRCQEEKRELQQQLQSIRHLNRQFIQRGRSKGRDEYSQNSYLNRHHNNFQQKKNTY